MNSNFSYESLDKSKGVPQSQILTDFKTTGFLVYRHGIYSVKEESNFTHLGYPSSSLESYTQEPVLEMGGMCLRKVIKLMKGQVHDQGISAHSFFI